MRQLSAVIIGRVGKSNGEKQVVEVCSLVTIKVHAT